MARYYYDNILDAALMTRHGILFETDDGDVWLDRVIGDDAFIPLFVWYIAGMNTQNKRLYVRRQCEGFLSPIDGDIAVFEDEIGQEACIRKKGQWYVTPDGCTLTEKGEKSIKSIIYRGGMSFISPKVEE